MRGATSPRLLLELMCAQVLLPAAATDEKSLLARLERLERGTSAPMPRSSPRAPHSGNDDHAERSGVTAPDEQRAPEAASSVAPAPALATPSRPASPTESPRESSAGPPREPPAGPPAASTAGSPGLSPADSLRKNWDAVLDAIKRERRVAWILLSNASVLSVQDGTLTLRFARDGDLKGFTTSGCDADLKRVLSTGFGLNVMVKGVVGGDPGSGARVVGGDPGSGAAGLTSRPAAPDPGSASLGASRPPAAAKPEVTQPGTGHDDESPDEVEMPPDEDEMPPDEDEMPADDGPSSHRPGPAAAELTPMDLIQRELGGQVISEIDS
jgi:DNA polymerase-3 subunit gamma/tau